MEPTSEQELKQLLEEGKITEEEYQELLEAIRQKETTQKPVEKPNEPKPRTGYGKAALILMIAGFLLPLAPLILNAIMSMQAANGSSPRIMMFTGCPFLFLGFLCLLLAFIFGIIGWKTKSGKIAAIGVPCMGLLIVLGGVVLLPLFFMPHCVEVQESQQRHRVRVLSENQYLEIRESFPLDSMEGVLSQDGVEFDERISSDNNGSLRIQTTSSEKTVIRLFESGPMIIENRMLIYSAKVKSELESGRAYLEMWCYIPGKGEFFSRGLGQPISGSTNWTTLQTPFRFEAGQTPTDVKLNLVIEGVGTVWIDDIKLLSKPLD